MGFRVVEGINPNHTTTTKIKTIDIVIEVQEENIIIIKINKLSDCLFRWQPVRQLTVSRPQMGVQVTSRRRSQPDLLRVDNVGSPVVKARWGSRRQ